MSLTFDNNGQLETFNQLDQGTFVYETDLKFPAKFSIHVFGKGDFDTEVDEQGVVINDKYIRLLEINVDGMSCYSDYVHHHIFLHTNHGQSIQTNYWGFNGRVNLDFDYDNSFFWALQSVDHA